MSISGGSGGQTFIVLDGLLHVLGSIFVDVMMGPNRLLQFIIDNLARALGAWATNEQHYAGTSVGVGALRKSQHFVKFSAGRHTAANQAYTIINEKSQVRSRSNARQAIHCKSFNN